MPIFLIVKPLCPDRNYHVTCPFLPERSSDDSGSNEENYRNEENDEHDWKLRFLN